MKGFLTLHNIYYFWISYFVISSNFQSSMKTIFTRIYFLAVIIILGTSTKVLHAQILEEIPNPPGYSLSFFSGGEGESLFFNYFDNNFNTSLYNYNGVDLSEIPIPPEMVSFLFYSHNYADKDYIVVFDLNFNTILYEYDGITAEPLAVPAGTTFGNYVATYNDLMYFTVFDANFNNTLYQYDGQVMEEVSGPEGLIYNGFIAEYNETLWITYFDPVDFSTSLFSFDGTSYASIGGLPDEVSFMYLAYANENNLLLAVADNNFVIDLYEFDGTGFNIIPTPDDLFFSFVPGENADAGEIYINYFDNISFTGLLYAYDGTTLAPIPIPEGFDFPNIVSVFNGFTYISLFEVSNFNGALFKLEAGQLGPVDIPNNGNYAFHADTLLGEDYHIVYDQNFNGTLFKLDEENNALVEVPGPPGFNNFGNYATVVNDKMFVSYLDANFFGTLFIFDGTEFTEIQNPAGQFYSFFMTEQNGQLYFRYDSQNTFEGTLYKLTPNSLPTSLDNVVTTDINIPYFFQATDFSFADTDNGDSLSFIMITEIEQVGYLLWNGAHVYEGDIIPVDEIQSLIFTPLQDEEGSPYDAFRFKVGDGEAFSDEDYLMQINVNDPATSITENALNVFVSVAPVPANNYTNIQLNTTEAIGNLRLYVFNANGQMMIQNEYQGLDHRFNETLNVSDWPAGTYYVVGRTSIGQFAKPLLVQR